MRGSAAACGSARIPTGVLATVTAVVALMLVPMAGQASDRCGIHLDRAPYSLG